MRDKVFCSLDIGSSKLTAVVAKTQQQHLSLLANETLPVRGLSKGVVKDLASFVDCIQEILDKLNKKTRLRLRRVLISVNGDYISGRFGFAAFAISDKVNRQINLSDISYLRRQARLMGARIDETILHDFPQDYILDGDHSTLSPVGLLARKIQLNSYLISASHTLLDNIKTAVHQAGYEVEDVIFSGVASGFSSLSQEERERGVLLIDLGASFTTILFFKDKILRDFRMIAFGGNDITDSISTGLDLPWELAEEIKKTSLILSTADFKDSDKIVVRRTGSYKTLERKAIYESAKAGTEDFLKKIKEAIDSSTWKDKMECGIVGAGGTANLEGMLERIENYTGMPVKLGRIKDTSLASDIMGPQYAAAVGLLYYGTNFNNKLSLKHYLAGKTTFERIVNFLRHLYQDYF